MGGGIIDEDIKWMMNRDNIVDKEDNEDIWGEDKIYIYEWERGGMTNVINSFAKDIKQGKRLCWM